MLCSIRDISQISIKCKKLQGESRSIWHVPAEERKTLLHSHYYYCVRGDTAWAVLAQQCCQCSHCHELVTSPALSNTNTRVTSTKNNRTGENFDISPSLNVISFRQWSAWRKSLGTKIFVRFLVPGCQNRREEKRLMVFYDMDRAFVTILNDCHYQMGLK